MLCGERGCGHHALPVDGGQLRSASARLYFLNADDTTVLEASTDLVETFRPDLLPVTGWLDNHQSFISVAKLKAAVGWYTSPSWRELL